jgi:hypothetical protein
MKKLFLIFPLLLAACVSSPTFNSPQDAAATMKCETDDFDGKISCMMSELITCSADGSDSVMSCNGNRTHAYFKKVITNKKEILIAINGYVLNRGWVFPERAVDSDGNELIFKNTDSRTNTCTQYGCLTNEYFTILLDEKYIAEHTNSGISIKIYGQRGSARVDFPAVYVQGFDSYLKIK